jgi:hypothetical protein
MRFFCLREFRPMPDLLARPPSQPNPLITITLRRSTAIGIALSLLVHLSLLLITLHEKPIGGSQATPGVVVAHLRPRRPPREAAPAAPEVQPVAPAVPPPPQPPRRQRELVRPPFITRREITPRSVPPSLPPPPPPQAVDKNPDTDMMANVDARRQHHEHELA